MIHRVAGEEEEHLFNSSLPLPSASETLRHYTDIYCTELISESMWTLMENLWLQSTNHCGAEILVIWLVERSAIKLLIPISY